MTRTKYFVVYRLKDAWRAMGESERKWQAFTDETKAKIFFNKLAGKTRYRALSYGLGNVLVEHGRP